MVGCVSILVLLPPKPLLAKWGTLVKVAFYLSVFLSNFLSRLYLFKFLEYYFMNLRIYTKLDETMCHGILAFLILELSALTKISCCREFGLFVAISCFNYYGISHKYMRKDLLLGK